MPGYKMAMFPAETPGTGGALLEALHAAGGVDYALLAGEERVALAADFHLNLVAYAVRLERLPAGAGYRHQFQFGMNIFLHKIIITSLGEHSQVYGRLDRFQT